MRACLCVPLRVELPRSISKFRARARVAYLEGLSVVGAELVHVFRDEDLFGGPKHLLQRGQGAVGENVLDQPRAQVDLLLS